MSIPVSVSVTDHPSTHHGVLCELPRHLRRQSGRGGLLDQLLVATLHRTIPLAQMYYRAMLIGEYLNFHMPHATQITLEINAFVAERQGGRSLGVTESSQQMGDFITQFGIGRPDPDPMVSCPYGGAVLVGGGMHNHRRNPHDPAGTYHPQRDLATIGHEHFVEHNSPPIALV